MAMTRGVTAIAAMFVLATAVPSAGCFGYTRGAKAWSYVGNTLLVAAGGVAIGLDPKAHAECENSGCPSYTPPLSTGIVAGAVAIGAGLVGIVLNATRPLSKPAGQGR
jgi:hypothetical protein